MKRIVYLMLATSLVFVACKKEAKSDIDASIVENSAAIKFERDAIDFKDLTNGELVTGSFKFSNVGKYDLIISEVTTSCGCTVADYPKEAIKPGGEGMITVTYDSKGYSGKRITKEVTVISNTDPSTTKLHIFADVH
ncbi:MAG: DUF1573 domain-containing protein [Bacteroidales bacterium]|jgi:hypothetical protein|nr:DUF1573 domain-containing protein [Bacteroidales bacterium]